MKSGMAAALPATQVIPSQPKHRQGRLIFSSVIDEETYSLGTRPLLGDLGGIDA